ncbi:hypothetical protein M408DRAFT_334295 [Serendipita vermifera MAFF 305830]|uniref:Uncharacterized protein n=1 Tax=Serendipita vermifera MAFF 305830 TaxID=933852 RepID=A0A0C3A4X6_SERVB|nr:hypothetical protein M408DRAFT_334295 [Serendipita vermifera MAFF 305830]
MPGSNRAAHSLQRKFRVPGSFSGFVLSVDSNLAGIMVLEEFLLLLRDACYGHTVVVGT